MKSNLDFLSQYWSTLAKIGATAEGYLYDDPNACIYKIGMFAERLVKEIFAFEHLPEPVDDNSHSNRIKILKTEGLIERNSQIDNILFTLRKKRNDAVHEYDDSLDDAKSMLRLAHRLAVWFMQVYGDWNFTPEEFVLPEKEPDIDYKSIIEKQEAEIAELIKKVEDVKTSVSDKSKDELSEKAATVSEGMQLTEAETRLLIDDQLRKYGWEVDTNNLRFVCLCI